MPVRRVGEWASGVKQNERNRYSVDTRPRQALGTMKPMFNTVSQGASS
jgi:hypothetical protein